jgi:hypothetical protein
MTEGHCIMEDEIPRDGGLWPEYAYTWFLCVDGLEADIAAGTIRSFCVKEPVPFHGLDDLLLQLDRLLDETGQAGRWMELRHLTVRKADTDAHTEPPARRTPYYARQTLDTVRGELGTAVIRVFSRRNVSMQGEIRFLDRKGAEISFRSALELLQLLREWLELKTRK